MHIGKYDKSTISKFDIVGSYFVNLYYNEFYSKAMSIKMSTDDKSLTDIYKQILSTYLDFVNKPEFFKQIVKGIHAFCISTTKFTTMTHKECIEFMVHEFIPQKLWASLRESQKNKLFHETISKCISIFTEKITREYLHIIIDNHDQDGNITILQDVFLQIILLEKDNIYSKFLNPTSTNISIDVFKKKINDILKDKAILHKKINRFESIVEELKKLNLKNITTIQNQTNEISSLKNEIQNLSDIISKLQEKNKQLRKSSHITSTHVNNNDNNILEIKQSKQMKMGMEMESIPMLTVENINTINSIDTIDTESNIDIIDNSKIEFDDEDFYTD